jgi:hypothetical protein
MTAPWSPQKTSTHQDHVVAHVVGTTVLGYFQADEALHLLLDIGFVWTIYLDGEMGLVPQSVAISELNLNREEKEALTRDIRSLEGGVSGAQGEALTRVQLTPADCLIEEVDFYSNNEGHRILIRGEEVSLAVETSLAAGEMSVEAVA